MPKEAANRKGGYALINFLLDPAVNAKEVQAHGYPTTDSRVEKLLPEAILENPILYPAQDLLTPLEFGAAADAHRPEPGGDHGAVQGGVNLAAQAVLRGEGAAARHRAAPPAGSLWFLFLLVLPLAVILVYSVGERAPAGGYAPALPWRSMPTCRRAGPPSRTR